MNLTKQAYVLIAILNVCLLSWTSSAAQTSPGLTSLQNQLTHCRLGTPKTWTFQGFGAAQTALPNTVDANQLSFFGPSLPDGLRRTIPNQLNQLSNKLGISKDLVVGELVRQIRLSQCPIEVIGLASVEGVRRQNIRFAEARRDMIIAEIRALGIPDHAIYVGAAEISDTFQQLDKNRGIIIRTRPDLAWRCEVMPNIEAAFPNQGRIIPATRDTLYDEELESLRNLWTVLGPDLQTYPCQHIAMTQAVDAAAAADLARLTEQEIPALTNRIIIDKKANALNSISFGIFDSKPHSKSR